MALIACPDCGREISDLAPACPHCGRPMARAQPGPETREGALDDEAAHKKGEKWIFGCMALVVVVGFGAMLSGMPSDGTNSRVEIPSAADSAYAARQVCEGLVRDKLLSPTEAEFAPLTMRRATVEVEGGSTPFVGFGEATAPNPMGVAITHRFACVVDPDGSMRGNAILRETNPELYEEMIRLIGG